MPKETRGRHDEDETRFLTSYDPQVYAPAAVTVDVVAPTIREGLPHVLLARRAAQPQRGPWALPGGFVRAQDSKAGPADPDLPDAALRVLAEKAPCPPRSTSNDWVPTAPWTATHVCGSSRWRAWCSPPTCPTPAPDGTPPRPPGSPGPCRRKRPSTPP